MFSMDDRQDSFKYSYSAREQQEIRKIREKYAPPEESKLQQLRRLDAGATRRGTFAALVVGIISTLLLGVGMCCTMLWSDKFFVLGIVVGLIGIAGIGAAYPLYNRVTQKERQKIAPEILRLTDELEGK